MKTILLTLIAITLLMSSACKKGNEPQPDPQPTQTGRPIPPPSQKFNYTWRWNESNPNGTNTIHYEDWCTTADSLAPAVKNKNGYNVFKGGPCQ